MFHEPSDELTPEQARALNAAIIDEWRDVRKELEGLGFHPYGGYVTPNLDLNEWHVILAILRISGDANA